MLIAQEIVNQNERWQTGVVLFIAICIATMSFFYSNRLWCTSTLFVSKKKKQIDRPQEKGAFFSGFYLLFFLIKINVVSLLLHLLLKHYGISLPFAKPVLNYFTIVAATFLFFITHGLIRYCIAKVFEYENYTKINTEWVSYFNNLIIWILPFILVTIYNNNESEWMILITLGLTTIILLLRLILVFLNNKKNISNSLQYFILYLCTFEIMPIAFVIKFAMNKG